jgi:hypothetical protein
MAVELNPNQFRARLNSGAPLVKGVRGRTQALMNMTPQAREVATLKTAARAKNALKAKQNIVNRSSGVLTGSTGKTRRFTVGERRVN